MTTFIGFNTINQYKKFTLLDFNLIKQDLSNALNIKQGELPGRPQYGTTIWNYLFENQTPDTTQLIINELQRVVGSDPRLYLSPSGIQIYPQDNGIRIEMFVQVVNSSEAELLALFFNEQSRRASYV